MKMKLSQTAHLVEASPWPMQMSMMLGSLLLGMMMLMLNKTSKGLVGGMEGMMEQGSMVKLGLLGVVTMFVLWLSDMMSESVYTGNHTKKVSKGMMMGYMLFMMTEMMVFVSMFWTVLNTTMSPNNEMLGMWPPSGMKELEGLELPLNNTMMLLGSGMTVTMAHNKVMSLNKSSGMLYMVLTMMLSLWFTMNQLMEYSESSYTMNDSMFGSGFYVGTGLHGTHMMMGTMYMTMGLYSVWKADMTNNHHMGLETGMMYLHFVDMMWLMLYMMVYNPVWA